MQTRALSMADYDFKIQCLKGKDNVCADLSSRVVEECKINGDLPVDIDDRNYLISAINYNLFKLKEFASSKKVEDPAMMHIRPELLVIDVIRK